MLFKIFHIKNEVNDFNKSPHQYAGKQVQNIMRGIFILPLLIGLGVLVLLFLSGFTSTFGDPSGLARFFFFIFFVVGCILGGILWKMISLSRSITERAAKNVEDSVKQNLDKTVSELKDAQDIEVIQ